MAAHRSQAAPSAARTPPEPIPQADDALPSELISPGWPLKISVSHGLTALLLASLGLPVVASSPGDIVAAMVVLPILASGLGGRLVFEALTGSPRLGSPLRVAAAAVTAGALAVILVAIVGSALRLPLHLGIVFVAWALASSTMVLAAVTRAIEVRLGAMNRRIFFIGSQAQYVDLAREMGRRGDLGIVGRAGLETPAATEIERTALVERIAVSRATTLVLSSDAIRSEDLVSAASVIHVRGLRVRPLNEFYEKHFAKVPASELSRAWFLFDVAEIHQSRVYGRVKRILESAVAAVLLALSSPLIPFIAFLIKRSSPGPVFYRQQRVGQHGRIFSVTKLRTMTAPAGKSQAWATGQVARITPVGRFLRRYRLDELPQLWHVIRGDLSLVGPRPEQPQLVEQLTNSIEFYAARHCIRPGLTGWAQVNHGYGGSVQGTLGKLQYDFFYIRHQSLRLDLLILAATVRTILSGGGR